MGLETVHPAALDALNKRMTTDDFVERRERAASSRVSLRVFLLIAPPFVPHEEQDDWLLASVAFAEECGASVISLIPTRGGQRHDGSADALRNCFANRRAPTSNAASTLVAERRVPSPESRAPSPEPGVPSPEPRVPTRIFLDPWVDHAR